MLVWINNYKINDGGNWNIYWGKHILINKALAYETCNCICTPTHTLKTSVTCYITHFLHYENVFQMCSVRNVSVQKVFWSWYYKKANKRKYCPRLLIYFIQVEALISSLKHISNLQMVGNSTKMTVFDHWPISLG